MTTVSAVKESTRNINKSFLGKMLIQEIMPYSRNLSLKKGQDLKIRDESSRSLYYIENGAMDVSYTLDDTKVVVAVLGAKDFFGEIGFFDGISRVRDIGAIENTNIKVFSGERVEKMQNDDPELYGRFITFITRSICKKFRRVLEESEPLKAYAASLSTGAHTFVESRPLPLDFFKTKEGRQSNQIVEELKAELFNISLRLQQATSDKIPEKIQFNFNTAMDAFFNDLEIFNDTLESSELKDEVWGYLFKETFPYFMRSSLTERAYFKPNGYAGDFKMIEMMYRNQPSGDGMMGKLVDAWLLNRPPCRAVRGRRKFLAEMLNEQSARVLKQKEKVNIMNLACGPSRELFDFIRGFGEDEKINAICLDIDPEALKYTDKMSKIFSHKAKISFMKDNLIKWALGTSSHNLEKQDIIYSGGLFDYLDEDLFLMLANRCHEFLNPGGVLVIGNFRPNPDKIFMDHLLEWRLIYREQDELISIFSKSKFCNTVEIVAEKEAGIQLFAIAAKE
ncbi:MAG: class I SAM-dependent methyltransferase family protein [Desulfobacula sp.]|uniref:class I SAM-dependent methyltransferase family protein n=1 Tax=Desulfobacula sp. TaxID=2593537 RepID=UPI0025C5627A|nr:cyclic nucleotide-binding domain-containing protein [Desulfobacula sp.]MCD4721323.1 class I SAM-dependent methyltransferase family protein [Desulfobacula sp.]